MIMKQALVWPWLGNYPQALRWISRGLGALTGVPGTGAAVERARLYAMYGAVRIVRAVPQDTIKWCRRAVEEGEPVGSARGRCARVLRPRLGLRVARSLRRGGVLTAGSRDLRGDRRLPSSGPCPQQHGHVRALPGALGRRAGPVRARAEQDGQMRGDRWHGALATLERGEFSPTRAVWKRQSRSCAMVSALPEQRSRDRAVHGRSEAGKAARTMRPIRGGACTARRGSRGVPRCGEHRRALWHGSEDRRVSDAGAAIPKRRSSSRGTLWSVGDRWRADST